MHDRDNLSLFYEPDQHASLSVQHVSEHLVQTNFTMWYYVWKSDHTNSGFSA